MNLQKTIDDLEKQAAKYTEAANALRLLQQSGDKPALQNAPDQEEAPQQRGRRAKGGGAKADKRGSKRAISPETRARMSAAAKARYEKRRGTQDGQDEQGNQGETE